jgi:hypothetical protein
MENCTYSAPSIIPDEFQLIPYCPNISIIFLPKYRVSQTFIGYSSDIYMFLLNLHPNHELLTKIEPTATLVTEMSTQMSTYAESSDHH